MFSEQEGRWEYRADDTGAMIASVIQAIGYAAHQGGPWQPRLRMWLRRYLEEGQPPPFETLDLLEDDASHPFAGRTVGERIDGVLARLRSGRSLNR